MIGGDPDQASGLGLHCLSISHNKGAKLIWVNETIQLRFYGRCSEIAKHESNEIMFPQTRGAHLTHGPKSMYTTNISFLLSMEQLCFQD